MAPEILRGEGFSDKSDIFSVGSIMYSLLTRQNLFPGEKIETVLAKNMLCKLGHVRESLFYRSSEALHLVMLMLSQCPRNRPTASQALLHPWFSEDSSPLKKSLQMNKKLTSTNQSITVKSVS
jgi:serine/threonine protein kinase